MNHTESVPEIRRRSLAIKIVAVLAPLLVVFAIVFVVLLRETNPYLKKRAIELLEEKLNGDVELNGFKASVYPTLQIWGSGLVVHYEGRRDVPPLISIHEFTARGSVFSLFEKPWKVDYLELKGMVITVSHKGDQGQSSRPKRSRRLKDMPLLIQELVADNAQLIIVPRDPAKSPHTFDIHHLVMNHVGLHRAAAFTAQLTNPKPPGEIASQGSFGPWNAEEPGETALSAEYTFEKADLGVFKGISGILSSHGEFGGILDRIEIEGETETPDFTVASGGHPVDLHTEFKATVDGMNGDTLLHPVNARFLKSVVIANGGVVQTPEKKGREIKLDVTVDKGRLEDMLSLAVKSNTPLMTGPVKFKTKFDLPPGEGDVADRLKLDGTFQVQKAQFTAPQVRKKLETLSRKALGKAGDKDAGSSVATLQGRFALGNRIITLRQTTFSVPGANFAFAGTYALQNEALDFHGILRMDAKLSQTVTGFKSFLLWPVNPFFRKDHETQLPIKISGTREKPSFGLDFHHK
ncbi:MAG: hypothetical protein ACRD2U_14170 [Terriglobales bacterium]